MAKNLEKLKAQREKLAARIAAEEARLKTAERKKALQRKIVVGTCVLEKAKSEGRLEAFYQELGAYLTRKEDRALFDLAPLPEHDKP